MVFQIKQVAREGSSNPIVARCFGLTDLIQMARLSEERGMNIREACIDIMNFLLEAERVAKPLVEAIRQIEEKINVGGFRVQQPVGAIETPTVIDLGGARTFLKFGKQALHCLAGAMGVLLEKDFKGPHFHVVASRAKEVWGPDHHITKLLAEDQSWIKTFLEMRDEDEHPNSGKPFVEDFDIVPKTGGGYTIIPPRYFNGKPIQEFLVANSQNLLTFSEELIALGLETFYPPQVKIAQIPEASRNTALPVRFELRLITPPPK